MVELIWFFVNNFKGKGNKNSFAFGMFTFISNQLYKSEKVTSERPWVVDVCMALQLAVYFHSSAQRRFHGGIFFKKH